MKKITFVLALFLSLSYNAQNKEEIFETVDEAAEFKGGNQELANYISKEIKYPTKAKSDKIGGKVFIKFVVTKDGSVSNAQILKGVETCPEYDKEALRVISAMPKWIPAKKDGKVVSCYYNIPIKFDPA